MYEQNEKSEKKCKSSPPQKKAQTVEYNDRTEESSKGIGGHKKTAQPHQLYSMYY